MTKQTEIKTLQQQKDSKIELTDKISNLQRYLILIGQYLNLAQLSNYK